MSSVRPGNYELLEETTDEPDSKEDDKPRNIVTNVESNGHVKDGDVSSVQTESTRNVAETDNETIVVNVEVHEQKETKSASWWRDEALLSWMTIPLTANIRICDRKYKLTEIAGILYFF